MKTGRIKSFGEIVKDEVVMWQGHTAVMRGINPKTFFASGHSVIFPKAGDLSVPKEKDQEAVNNVIISEWNPMISKTHPQFVELDNHKADQTNYRYVYEDLSPVKIGDMVEAKVTSGRYGETKTHRGIITALPNRWHTIEIDGERVDVFQYNHALQKFVGAGENYTYDHGHKTYLKKITNEPDKLGTQTESTARKRAQAKAKAAMVMIRALKA
jgi:hypothetical protein